MTLNKKTNKTVESMAIQFGIRSVSEQNYSKILCIPRQALLNLGSPRYFEVALIMQGDQKFIKLTPIAEKKKGEEKN